MTQRYPDHSVINRIVYLMNRFGAGILDFIRIQKKIGLYKYFSGLLKKQSHTGQVAVVAIVKDEAPYLKEWLDYHRLIGVDRFFIYDNDSKDDTVQVLEPYIKAGIVEYKFFPGSGMQEKAYFDCARRVAGKVDWLITIDVDEFVQCLNGYSLVAWLEQLPKYVSQVEFGWMIYGSNGFVKKPDGMVIENYNRHATNDFLADYKSVVRPDRVVGISFPHEYQVIGLTVDENKKILWSYPKCSVPGARPSSKKKFRVNHYYSKSLVEFQEKSKRGDASVPNRKPRNISDFKEHDQNQIIDDSMYPYAVRLKESR